MRNKIRLVLALAATSIYYMVISSQPALAYRKREIWVTDTVSPFDRPEFLYPTVAFIIVAIASAIISFTVRDKIAMTFRRIALIVSAFTGVFSIIVGFPVIRVSSSVGSSVSGSPYIEDVYLRDPIFIPVGIVLLIGAVILLKTIRTQH